MKTRRQGTERRARRRAERGQAMMEFAVVATLFAVLMAGVLEFGRAWSAANVLGAAARDGARLAAVTSTNRNASVKSRVEGTAGSYFTGSDISVQVTGGKGASGEPIVTVAATGKLSSLFGTYLLGAKKIAMTRSVTMRDETVAN
jgi:Flp pilus assembly protein TadG